MGMYFDWDIYEDWPLFQKKSVQPTQYIVPAIDVYETENEYLVSAELPGFRKEDIKVSVQNGILKITAKSKHVNKMKKKGQIICKERQYGNFVRNFSLGSLVKEGSIKANYKYGVLSLNIPKKEEANLKV